MAQFNAFIGSTRTKTRFPSQTDMMSSVRKDMENVIKNYLAVTNRLIAVSPELMKESLKPVLQKAIYYCPVETGLLRSTAFLEIIKFRGVPRVEIGFGRGGKPYYALYVHEMMDLHHEPPTRAKFLSTAMFEQIDAILARLAAGYKRII